MRTSPGAKPQIHWRALPRWTPRLTGLGVLPRASPRLVNGYIKEYCADYRFPAAGTIAFEFNHIAAGMAVKILPPDPRRQIDVDNDRARWPCFFPCSLGMVTTWTESGAPNLMPCGSTTIVSRHPMVVAVAICHYPINDRYAPRLSLQAMLARGRFGCGVAYDGPSVIEAVRYAGNISFARDPDKVANAGLTVCDLPGAPMLPALPIHFDCRITGQEALGTHTLVFGEVERILVRSDISPSNFLEWDPWPNVRRVEA